MWNKIYPRGVDGDGELHEGPGPDDQHHHAEDLVRVHFVVLSFNHRQWRNSKTNVLVQLIHLDSKYCFDLCWVVTLKESKNSMISAAVPI